MRDILYVPVLEANRFFLWDHAEMYGDALQGTQFVGERETFVLKMAIPFSAPFVRFYIRNEKSGGFVIMLRLFVLYLSAAMSLTLWWV